MASQRHAVIVGGGSGWRMGTEVPKQFLPLAGTPVIVRTITAFIAADPDIHLVVVVPRAWMEHFAGLVEQWELPRGLVTVSGGDRRYDSVKNGLAVLSGRDGLVAVHDAVRPLLDTKLITRVFEAAHAVGSAVPAVPVKESLRQVDGTSSKAVSRDALHIVQTPQCFRLKFLCQAYEKPFEESFTDCATVMERAGETITLVEGEPINIKITTKADFLFAQWYLSFGRHPDAGLSETPLGAAF